MSDKKNYERRTLVMFEALGCFFIDTFYNTLYLKARDATRAAKSTNVTDAYRSNIVNYTNGVRSHRELYVSVIKSMHSYYQNLNGCVAVGITEFEDNVLREFIPRDYYRKFTPSSKDAALTKIVTKIISELCAIVLSKEILPKIIDDHLNKANVEELQDKIQKVLIILRETFYYEFARENTKGRGAATNDSFERLKAAFLTEVRKRSDAEKENERTTAIIVGLLQRIKTLETAAASTIKQSAPSFDEPKTLPPAKPDEQIVVPVDVAPVAMPRFGLPIQPEQPIDYEDNGFGLDGDNSEDAFGEDLV